LVGKKIPPIYSDKIIKFTAIYGILWVKSKENVDKWHKTVDNCG